MLPARAGMIRLGADGAVDADGAPRASGDDPVSGEGHPDLAVCSPRERG